MRSDIIQEAELLKKELKEKLLPVNTLLVRATELGLSISITESYGNPSDKDGTNAIQVQVNFSIHLL